MLFGKEFEQFANQVCDIIPKYMKINIPDIIRLVEKNIKPTHKTDSLSADVKTSILYLKEKGRIDLDYDANVFRTDAALYFGNVSEVRNELMSKVEDQVDQMLEHIFATRLDNIKSNSLLEKPLSFDVQLILGNEEQTSINIKTQ